MSLSTRYETKKTSRIVLVGRKDIVLGPKMADSCIVVEALSKFSMVEFSLLFAQNIFDIREEGGAKLVANGQT